jgi:hypothetical protein
VEFTTDILQGIKSRNSPKAHIRAVRSILSEIVIGTAAEQGGGGAWEALRAYRGRFLTSSLRHFSSILERVIVL